MEETLTADYLRQNFVRTLQTIYSDRLADDEHAPATDGSISPQDITSRLTREEFVVLGRNHIAPLRESTSDPMADPSSPTMARMACLAYEHVLAHYENGKGK